MSMGDNSTKKKQRSSSSSSKMRHQQLQQEEEAEVEVEKKNQENIVQSNTNNQTTSLHYYLNASQCKFKQMLRNAIVGGQNILEWCNTEEKLIYIYEHTRLLDSLLS